MRQTLKKFYKRLSVIVLAIILIFFFIFAIFTLIIEGSKGSLDPITFVSLTAVILSFPGIVNTIVDEYVPKKKTYTLSSNCPKCKHLIRMNMREE
ncbi:hypothetical protein [Solibacillus sp. FSL K6-1523]|uniref:hypothetical protein n=1 Tax=Solibacillus sp. FSL K6-1523 TaxID=2921471 RepID=UPI0030FA3062